MFKFKSVKSQVILVRLISFGALLLSNTVGAAIISGLYSTGVDNSGTVLPLGTLDPHYILSGPSTPAKVIAPNPSWIAAPGGSDWIGPSNGSVSDPLGIYTYSLSFDLSGMNPNTAVISGNLAADNTPTIFLNGIDTGFSHPNQFFTLEPFIINSGFISGINQLEFRVTNNPGLGTNPTGLLITNLAGEVSAVPVPAAGWLFFSGLIGLALSNFRKVSSSVDS